MWIAIVSSAAIALTVPVAAVMFADWYAQRCVKHAGKTIQQRLTEYEAIAAQYTKDGTPEELRSLMGKMEELADDLQVLEDNNPFKREN
eukprot:COSAG02_NODE_3661_length_6407_cov_7.761297_6_plen_89_part_00